MSFSIPALNAFLNGCAWVCLTLGFVLILKGRGKAHRAAMLSALAFSALFLFFYVLDKILKGGVHTEFMGEGFWRGIYYPLLISHVLLAMVILPLVFRTYWLAARKRFKDHRRWARWTFPIWYYVSITGVLIYFFLYHWF